MRLTIIGCSSGMPSGHQSTSSYLLEADGAQYLLDCGDGTAAACIRLGIDPNQLKAIFISHLHPDHSMGLPLLIQMMHLRNRTGKLEIYLPREAEDGFKRLFYMTYLFFERLGFEIQFVGIEGNFKYDDGNIQITLKPNGHLLGLKDYIMQRTLPNRMQCFSMAASACGKKLVYSSDVGAINDLAPLLDNADLLLTEGMHFNLEELPDLLIKKNVKQVILTHLPDQSDLDSIRMIFEKQGFSNLQFAREGLTILI